MESLGEIGKGVGDEGKFGGSMSGKVRELENKVEGEKKLGEEGDNSLEE